MNVWISSIWMSSYCNFVQQEACILGLTNHGCYRCPCWDTRRWRYLLHSHLFYCGCGSSIPNELSWSCGGGDEERNGDLGGLRRNAVTPKITRKNHTPKGTYRFAMVHFFSPPHPQMCLPPPPPLPLGKLPQKLTDSILPYLPPSLCVKCCAMSAMRLARDNASTPYVPLMHSPSATAVAVVVVCPHFRFVFHMVPRMLKLHPYC